MNKKNWALGVGFGLIGLFLVMQILPVGAGKSNPPVTAEPQWDSAETRALAERACFDCHSNQTRWPAYAYVAPFSWSVEDHVAEAREKMNMSEWDKPQDEADDAAEEVSEGEMPPAYYTLLHPSARLTAQEREVLARGLQATMGGELEGGVAGEGRRRAQEEADDDD